MKLTHVISKKAFEVFLIYGGSADWQHNNPLHYSYDQQLLSYFYQQLHYSKNCFCKMWMLLVRSFHISRLLFMNFYMQAPKISLQEIINCQAMLPQHRPHFLSTHAPDNHNPLRSSMGISQTTLWHPSQSLTIYSKALGELHKIMWYYYCIQSPK